MESSPRMSRVGPPMDALVLKLPCISVDKRSNSLFLPLAVELSGLSKPPTASSLATTPTIVIFAREDCRLSLCSVAVLCLCALSLCAVCACFELYAHRRGAARLPHLKKLDIKIEWNTTSRSSIPI